MRSIVVYPRDPVPEPDPALITLDLPIPSIPLLGPILTQLIAGRPTTTATIPAATSNTTPANQPTTSATPQTTNKSPTTTTKTTAASTPTSGSSSGNSGSNSGNSAGSNGSSGSNSSSGSGTNSGNGSSNSNSNSQSGSGSSSGSSGNGSSSSSPQNGTNNNNNNNTSGTNGNSTSNSGDESGSSGNNSKNENISVVNNNLVAISSNSDGKLTTSTIVAGVGGVDNVGTLPSGIALSTRTLDSGSKTVIVITPTPSSATVVTTGKGHGTSPVMVTITAGSGSGSGSGSNGGSDNSGSTKDSHIAAGALVGIIVGAILILLLLIGGFLALKRHRYQHKREQRRQAWGIGWWKKNEDRNRGIGYTPSRESRAARSSFGSMVDRGLRPVTPLAGAVSSNGHDLENGTNGALFYSGTDDLHAQTRRESIVTDSSEMVGEAGSASRTLANESGYLYVADGRGYLEAPQLSPISVRPFSPSETFSFPQPPQSISTNSLRSARTSRTSYTFANDPFADPSAHFIPSSPPPSPPPPPSQSILPQSQSPTTAAANTRVETIQRPFAPTLEDELSVKPGDKVVMLEIFDDGWAKIRRFNKDENKSEEGLIPIDCLREKGEDVPAFLAAKRISSYRPSADRVSIKY